MSVTKSSFFSTYFELLLSKGRQPEIIGCRSFVCVKTMANLQNLKPFTSEQSREEAVKNGRKGGIASGVAKRENKLIRERILERMGEDDWDTMIDNLIERASNDTKSFEVLRDTIGQKPVEKVAVGASDEAKSELAELLEQRKNAGK